MASIREVWLNSGDTGSTYAGRKLLGCINPNIAFMTNSIMMVRPHPHDATRVALEATLEARVPMARWGFPLSLSSTPLRFSPWDRQA